MKFPSILTGITVTPSAFRQHALLQRNPNKDCVCLVYETIGIPTVAKDYYHADSPMMIGKDMDVTPKKLGVPTYYFLRPVNRNGPGIISDPEGGTFV